MAKSIELTAKYQAEMKNNNVHKKYIARVKGKLDKGTFTVDHPLYCADPRKSRHAIALTPEAIAQSKPALTTFTVIWYDEVSDTSLLYCYPLTGRTHQIRVHLQSVGHSIVNDVNYGGMRIGNVLLAKLRGTEVHPLGKRVDAVDDIDDNGMPMKLIKCGDSGIVKIDGKDGKCDIHEKVVECKDQGKVMEKNDGTKLADGGPVMEGDGEWEGEELMKMFGNYGNDEGLNYTPFNEERIMEIWLHSHEYTILGKTVTTDMPYWAEKSVLHNL
jgi:RNA pseudouridylate synthase